MRSKHLACAIAGALVSLTAAAQDGSSLKLRSGFEIGGQVSDYRYEEPDPGTNVSLDGTNLAFVGAYTLVPNDDFYARFELRHAYGELYYEGSGTMDEVPNTIIELRALLGAQIATNDGAAVTPYIGIGHRYLYNDLRGITSTGAIGYQRYSRYLYIPLGISLRFHAGESWIVAPSIEYDYFVRGEQESTLSDTGLGIPDVTTRQRKGYGYRASLMFEKGHLAFGPWVQGWDIEDSDLEPIGGGVFVFEPKNETFEAGVEVKYRF